MPQGLSNTLYACGQLGISPPTDWLQQYWHASASKLGEFKPQELSNTLYACAQLGITPPADWLQWFWHASASKLGTFNEQSLSNTLQACGQLDVLPPADWLGRYWKASALELNKSTALGLSNTLIACAELGATPPADWLQRYWRVSSSKMGELMSRKLSTMLVTLAQLDITPPAGWLQSFSDSFKRSIPDSNLRCLNDAALALAALELWELPLWPVLWEHICQSLPRDAAGWDEEAHFHARRFYRVYRAAAVERPGLLSAPDQELLAAARKSWTDHAHLRQDAGRSRIYADIAACLTRMGVAHTHHRWCNRTECTVNVAIEGATPVAVEVRLPHHLLKDGRPTGFTLLRSRMLAAHGWRVLTVDFHVWEELMHHKTGPQREDYLRRMLVRRV